MSNQLENKSTRNNIKSKTTIAPIALGIKKKKKEGWQPKNKREAIKELPLNNKESLRKHA